MSLPTIFDCCEPRREVLAGELPDAIFAADLWDVIRGRAHPDYQDPLRFFEGTHPTDMARCFAMPADHDRGKINSQWTVFLQTLSSIAAEAFGPQAEPRWLRLEDGMRLALGFACARYLVKADDRRRFAEGLKDLPSEVILYWFTLCFYGYRQAAGRVALRTLLTHEEPEERPRQPAAPAKPAARRRPPRQKQLALEEGQELAVREELERYSSSVIGRA